MLLILFEFLQLCRGIVVKDLNRQKIISENCSTVQWPSTIFVFFLSNMRRELMSCIAYSISLVVFYGGAMYTFLFIPKV